MTPSPFVVGAPRSGTTLLRLVLDAHRDLAIPPETGFLLELTARQPRDADAFVDVVAGYPREAPTWPDFGIDRTAFRRSLDDIHPFDLATAVRRFYSVYAARHGKARWGDKTPSYGPILGDIAKVLPEARFVHLVRDGRDVVASLREQWFAPSRSVAELARHWRDYVLATRRAGASIGSVLELRFEDLVRSPKQTVDQLRELLALGPDDAMLRHHERAEERLVEHGARRRIDGSVLVSLERRRAQQSATRRALDSSKIGTHLALLTRDDKREFEGVAGDLLAELGYPV